MASENGTGPESGKGKLFVDVDPSEDPLLRRGSSRDVFEPLSQSNSSRFTRSTDSHASKRFSPRATERQKVSSEADDPLAQKVADDYDPVQFVTKENLSIRKEDETRIVAALHNAAKKQCTGSIYSVVVDLGKTGTLGIGVKDLPDHVLAVSMLKRENCCPGAGEDAGVYILVATVFVSLSVLF
jgi:hypothetical protein